MKFCLRAREGRDVACLHEKGGRFACHICTTRTIAHIDLIHKGVAVKRVRNPYIVIDVVSVGRDSGLLR